MNFPCFNRGQLTIPPSFQCRSGVVNLFKFIMAPEPGSVIATVTTMAGIQIPLILTQSPPPGGLHLADVDGQFATVCGPFVQVNGQSALDVRIVNPGVV